MKKLLVIGAGRLQLPAFLVARRMGLWILTVDRDPRAPGMGLADAAYPLDTGDADGIVALATRERIDGVLALCTDQPVKVVARVGAALGLSTLTEAAAANATHKGLMRDAFASASVPIPRYCRVHSLSEAHAALADVGLPAIVKPPASAGSRGIFRISRPADLVSALAHASGVAGRDSELVIEEFIEGPEVSVETISHRGEHRVIAITDKRTSGDPHWVEMGHVEPSSLPAADQDAIRAATVEGLKALGVDNAGGHVEIKMGRRGPVLIEIGARLGGDFISTELVKRSTGVDMVEAVIRIALGEEPSLGSTLSKGAAIRYLQASAGRAREIVGEEAARGMPGVARLEIDVAPGDEVQELRSSLDRPGFVICEGSDARTAEERAEAASRAIQILT